MRWCVVLFLTTVYAMCGFRSIDTAKITVVFPTLKCQNYMVTAKDDITLTVRNPRLSLPQRYSFRLNNDVNLTLTTETLQSSLEIGQCLILAWDGTTYTSTLLEYPCVLTTE